MHLCIYASGELASLSDDWSMLQKLSCFCLKKLNHLSMLIKSYTDAALQLAISCELSRLATKFAKRVARNLPRGTVLGVCWQSHRRHGSLRAEPLRSKNLHLQK